VTSLRGGSLHTDLYTKPTDKHLYLHMESSHPEATKKAIPYGLGVRVKRICSEESNYRKHRVCTSENPADVATRGTSIDKLIVNECWWSGPKWILLPERSWSDQQIDHKDIASEIHELCSVLIQTLVLKLLNNTQTIGTQTFVVKSTSTDLETYKNSTVLQCWCYVLLTN